MPRECGRCVLIELIPFTLFQKGSILIFGQDFNASIMTNTRPRSNDRGTTTLVTVPHRNETEMRKTSLVRLIYFCDKDKSKYENKQCCQSAFLSHRVTRQKRNVYDGARSRTRNFVVRCGRNTVLPRIVTRLFSKWPFSFYKNDIFYTSKRKIKSQGVTRRHRELLRRATAAQAPPPPPLRHYVKLIPYRRRRRRRQRRRQVEHETKSRFQENHSIINERNIIHSAKLRDPIIFTVSCQTKKKMAERVKSRKN